MLLGFGLEKVLLNGLPQWTPKTTPKNSRRLNAFECLELQVMFHCKDKQHFSSESVWSRWNLFSCTLQMFLTSCYILSSDFINKLCRLGLSSSHPAAIQRSVLDSASATGSDLARVREWKAGRAKKMDGVVLLFWLPFGNLSHSYWKWPKIQLI